MARPSLLLANINHCRAAQDLLTQFVVEEGIGLSVVTEPYGGASTAAWAFAEDRTVAIFETPGADHPPVRVLRRGAGYVAVSWGTLVVVGCYVSPNSGLAAFENFLDDAGTVVREHAAKRLLLLGDLNAKTEAWGCRLTDVRGHTLLDWAAGHGLRVLNRGRELTCVRRVGGSIRRRSPGSGRC